MSQDSPQAWATALAFDSSHSSCVGMGRRVSDAKLRVTPWSLQIERRMHWIFRPVSQSLTVAELDRESTVDSSC